MDRIETVASIFLAWVLKEKIDSQKMHFIFCIYYVPCACQKINLLYFNTLMKMG
jgi:hypothetical protein